MTTLNWLRSGRSPSGTPARPKPQQSRVWILVLLALAGASQTGCQSGGGMFGPCGPCSGMGSGISNNLRNLSERMFRPFHRGCKGCSTCGVGQPGCVEYGTPVGAPVTGPIVTPGPAATIPSGTESMPQQLEANPSADPAPKPGDSGARNSTPKASYEAYRTRPRASRSAADSLAKSSIPLLEPAPSSSLATKSTPAKSSNPLDDDLGPLLLPNRDDTTNYGSGSPSPPAVPAADAPKPVSAVPAPAETRTEAASAASASLPTPVSPAPGIQRFSNVDAKLSGGSVPNPTGLEWLDEKGYKTIVDLRETTEVPSSFIAEVTRRGIRYVALPIPRTTLNADHVSRFNLELSLADVRPLYFCDTDGNRAGALWYIRRLTQDKIDPQVASREAEELGLTDKALWQAASNYLEAVKNTQKESKPPVTPAQRIKSFGLDAPSDSTTARSQVAPTPLAAMPEVPGGDPTGWGSYAALAVTVMGVPLAYLSTSSLPSLRDLKRASLPGLARSRRSLPSKSDV